MIRCSACPAQYDEADWPKLKPCGLQDPGVPGYALELRDCSCGSTLSRPRSLGGYVSAEEYAQAEAAQDAALRLEREDRSPRVRLTKTGKALRERMMKKIEQGR